MANLGKGSMMTRLYFHNSCEFCARRVATGAGLKTGWSDKALQYNFVAGPGNPLDLSDRITEFKPVRQSFLCSLPTFVSSFCV